MTGCLLSAGSKAIPIDSIAYPSLYVHTAEVLIATGTVCLISPLSIKYSGNSNVVPVTPQSLIVLLVPSILGSKRGCLSIGLYLFCGGILELPVFAKGTAGRDKLVGPTGGFMWGFVIAAYYMGTALESHSSLICVHEWILLFFIGHLIILTFGFTWLRMIEPDAIPSVSFLFQEMIRPLLPGLCMKTIVGATLGNACSRCLLERAGANICDLAVVV